MRTRIVWSTAIFIVFTGFGLSHGQEVVNLLENGGFETGDMAPWSTYGPGTSEVVTELTGAAVPEAPIEGTHALHITIPGPGANFWDAGLQHGGHVFESGKHYTLSAFLKSKSGELNINFKPELAQDPWTGYGAQAFTMTEEWTEFSTTTPVFTSDVNPASITFHIQYDEGDFWVDGVRWYEGDYVPPAFKPVVEAANPSPADGAVNVPQDVILAWEPGPFAALHDVYFGESFDDVNVAPTMDTLEVLKSNDQPGTTYDPDGLLDFGKTYYWRIDEVNAPPDSTVFKGAVWSFTVEPLAYPITNVTATASSENTADMGPGNTVDGSGINADDEHSVEPTDMWLSSALPTAPQPTWIQFEFDDVYDLYEMWIWNSNQLLEPVIGFGVQNATLEHSLDGENWTSLGEYEIPRAPGTPDNPHDATISLAGTTARFVRLTVNSGWGGILDQFGLAEVRFFVIPVAASDPSPAVRDSGVPLDVTLDWRAGREAVKHEVYFSKDEAAVADGTALVDTVEVTNYQPGTLEYGQIYYWKVNEVNDAAAAPVREGEVWEFSTVENFVVEDFESYSAEDPIWETWIDGLGFGVPGTPDFNPGNGTGSAVGDDTQPSFTEEIIVNSGGQSMPLFYDNNKAGAANYSETERTFDQPQNWTTGGVSQLSLWFRGHAASVGSFVEGPAGTFTMTGSGADITGPADEFHYAYKMLSGQGSIVARIDSIQNTHDWAKAGVMIRETLDPGSPHATAFVTPANGVVFEYRLTPGDNNVGAASQQTGITAPHWVKLERSISGAFTVSQSANGSSWQPLGNNASANIQMGTSVYIGLALTSHDAGATCEAVFSNVTTTGNVSGQWINQDIGIASNAPEPLYIGLADSAGNSATLEHEDPAACRLRRPGCERRQCQEAHSWPW
ncbi:MAG: carbohydrate binding domain-containing protein [Planctomycetota bacterium]